MSPLPPDFDRLFAEGGEHDFSRLREGCVVTVRVQAGPDLRLPTGRLVACEPGAYFYDGAAQNAFVQQVEPGSYPLRLVIADIYDPGNPQGYTRFAEVAAARLVIRDEPVDTWRLALRYGQNEADRGDDEYYAYPVDGGMGSFASPEVLDALSAADELDSLMVEAGDLVDFDEAGVYTHEATGENVVFFHTGGGDGAYATWVGYTAGGEVACFVTDFQTLTAG